MSLSDRDCVLIGRVMPGNTSVTHFKDFRCGLDDLAALLDAARDEERERQERMRREEEAERGAARQEGSAERDGGDGVPVRLLSVQATDKSDRAEGVAALQQAGAGKEEHVWQRGGKRWTPPLHWQEIYEAITEYAAKPDHMYTEVERLFATHAVDLADAVAGALSGERTYTQAEVDSILRAAFPLKTPDERAALSNPLPQQTALVEAASHDSGD